MTVETSLRIEFKNEVYDFMVKMIRIDFVSYFFIRDKINGKPFLKDRVLELTYTDSFSLTEFGGQVKSPGISAAMVNTIQQAILEHEELWL